MVEDLRRSLNELLDDTLEMSGATIDGLDDLDEDLDDWDGEGEAEEASTRCRSNAESQERTAPHTGAYVVLLTCAGSALADLSRPLTVLSGRTGNDSVSHAPTAPSNCCRLGGSLTV